MTKRHLIFADPHGNLELVDRIFAHCGFVPGVDVAVAAGDVVDIGKGSMAILKKLEAVRGILLLGNHEFAHIIGEHLQLASGQSAYDSSLDWKHNLPAMLVDRVLDGSIRLAHAVDGVLVTHAGLSEHAYGEALAAGGIAPDRNLAAEQFAALLNRLLPTFIQPPLYPLVDRFGSWTPGEYGYSLLGTGESLTPLWFRPGQDGEPSLRYPQVYGHTSDAGLAKQDRVWLAEHGCFSVDPWSPDNYDRPGYVKYALVEHGEITVVTDWDGRETA